MSSIAGMKFASLVLESTIKSELLPHDFKLDERQTLQNLTQFNSFMKVDGGSQNNGVIGNMASNGLRSDSWVNQVDGVTRQKIQGIFADMSDVLQKSSLIRANKFDVSDPKVRNELINKLVEIFQKESFKDLNPNDQKAAVLLAKMLGDVAGIISSQRQQFEVKRGMESVSVDVTRNLPSHYRSPTGEIISATAQKTSFWRSSHPTHMCQKSVTTVLHKALKTAHRATAENPILAARGRVYEKGYGLVRVEGATFADVLRAPIGAVVLYDNPHTSAKNGAHAALKVDSSERGWMSDFKHDAYVYGDTPPKNLKFYLYIPKDCLSYFSKLT